MKKTLFTGFILLITVWIIITTVLAYNVDINIGLRAKINQLLKPYTIVSGEVGYYYQSSTGLEIVENMPGLKEKNTATNKHYFDVRWISPSQLTFHYDSVNNQLNITGHDLHVEIYKDMSVTINDQVTDFSCDVYTQNGNVYIPFEDVVALGLQDRLGIKLLMSENGNVIFSNQYTQYRSVDLAIETYLFKDVEMLDQYLSLVRDKERFFDVKRIFTPAEVIDVLGKERVIVFEVDDKMLQVITSQGLVGYVIYGDHIVINEAEANSKVSEKNFVPRQEPVVLTWEAVYGSNPDTDSIGEMKSLNTISPTWYELSDTDGSVQSKASMDYVKWAKNRNYEVWALVSNAFDLELTHGFLKNAPARKRFIETMIKESLEYGYEGINIDFENVYLEDKDALTHFVQEFAYYAHKNNLTLSMDVTVMGGSDTWSKCYDHEALGRIVDFLVIMTYDEFWASSPISGPVASYDWVRRHIVEIAKIVNPKKMVLGVPLYTRVWRERPSADVPNKMVVKSSAVGMPVQNDFVERNNISLIWDEVDKLYYGAFFEEDALVKIWVENSETISNKVLLVNELGLAGVATWRRGFEIPEIWDTIYEALK